MATQEEYKERLLPLLDEAFSPRMEEAALAHEMPGSNLGLKKVKYHRQSRWLEILNRSKRLNNLSCLKAAAIQTDLSSQ